MGSYIQIDSIYIDLTNSDGKREAGKCENFSIRGYVSEIHKKDWKACWPFPIYESEENTSCPQLDDPKYRCWCCPNCPQESASEDINKDDTNCSTAALQSATQQDPMPNTLERREIDLNTYPGCDSDFLPFSNEKEKKAGVALNKRIGTGCKDNGVSGVERASNHKCMDKSSSEIYNERTPSADNQCQTELIKVCSVLGDIPTATKADKTTNHTTGPPPLYSVACNRSVPSGSTRKIVESDFQGLHLEKKTAFSRRRPRKVRLMTHLLSEKSDLKTDKLTIQGSPSHGTSNASEGSQSHSMIPGKVDTQGESTLTNMCHSKKRKFILDEAPGPEDMCVQGVAIEVQKGDATKYKDVMAGIGLQDVTRGFQSKSEIERNHIMGKKSRKIKVIDNHLIPEPHQGKQRVNEDTVYPADKAYASKTLYSRFTPRAITEKGMDKFPFHAPRTENEFSLSKGKGKILQTHREMGSLSCQKNATLVKNPFAYSGGKIMSNMPVTIPIPSAQGTLNGKGVEEGLQHSLNSQLAVQIYDKKCIHQTEIRLPFGLPLQEDTSNVHQQKRKDSETIVYGGVHCEETTGARNKEKTVEAVEKLGVLKRCSEQTVLCEEGALDDIPMEIVELLAKNQYERCLPDAENRSSIFEKSTVKRKIQMTDGCSAYGKGNLSLLKKGQKKKHEGAHKKSFTTTKREIVKPSKRKSVHYYSPFDGNNLGTNNARPLGPPFPHMGSSHLGSARNCNFNGIIEECGSSNATLQANVGCSLHNTILQQDNEASRIWASLTSNHVSLGYDVPKMGVFQPTSASVDITSIQSGALHKQRMRRDIDLNCRNLHVAGPEMLNRNKGPGTVSRTTGRFPFPEKHNGMEPYQNLRGSVDVYSAETISAMHLLSLMDAGKQPHTSFNEGAKAQMLRRPYHGNCSTKLEIGTSKTHNTPKKQSFDYYSRSYLSDKSGGCFLGSPTFVPSSSTQRDMKILRDDGAFAGQNSIEFGKKEKAKSSNSFLHDRLDVRGTRKIETPVQHKLDFRGTRETVLPVRVTLGSSCMVNKNPADFTMPETGNVYMINGVDLKFEKIISKKRPHFPTPRGCKKQRNLKVTKAKEHSKH
ncbi:PREDICTED: protein EMBRYONIC FLOWER 1-like isoform X2 [Lupinus angustifolius]|uniref:protein EMBRYONIC FLOWER 1-like isoform X2 n=1 Tax=Lupinus angustifolius TaxID=3871 RepID=UPI00092E97FA|nr:PREDICTED: protein EMBRYONIC FLOWER 1-like isoform X2 [Lupinus angustifolius]